MKKILILSLIVSFFAPTVYSQDIKGSWSGSLEFGGKKTPLIFNITENDGNYSATLDSPSEGVKDIPVSEVSFDNLKLKLSISNIGMEYEGELKNDTIFGTFKQMGMTLPLNLCSITDKSILFEKPQDPRKPYPYKSEDIIFDNKKAGISLAGTFTFPDKGDNFSVVVLISGSGAQNRDMEILGHRPFLVLSDYLTLNGIAVLRFDERGVGESEGDFTSATTEDFASDIESAVEFLKTRKEINIDKIGLIGISEGGIIAPMIAARSNDISFIVMLAGSGVSGDKILLRQSEIIARALGMTEDKIAKTNEINKKIYDKITEAKKYVSNEELKDILNELKTDISEITPASLTLEEHIEIYYAQMSSPWMQYFIRYNPAPALEKVRCPVLVLNGSKDLQICPKQNLPAISEALKTGGNTNVTVKEYPDLNHLFQHCTTGLPNEYNTIEETMSPEVMKDIALWINEL